MITITWKCDDCGKVETTEGKFYEYYVDEDYTMAPDGWGAFLDETRVLCATCLETAREKYEKDNPGAVPMA